MQARLSHRERALYFGTNVLVAQTEEDDEGPQLQVSFFFFFVLKSIALGEYCF